MAWQGWDGSLFISKSWNYIINTRSDLYAHSPDHISFYIYCICDADPACTTSKVKYPGICGCVGCLIRLTDGFFSQIRYSAYYSTLTVEARLSFPALALTPD